MNRKFSGIYIYNGGNYIFVVIYNMFFLSPEIDNGTQQKKIPNASTNPKIHIFSELNFGKVEFLYTIRFVLTS